MWRFIGVLITLLAYVVAIISAIRLTFYEYRHWHIPAILIGIGMAALGGGMIVFGQPWPS